MFSWLLFACLAWNVNGEIIPTEEYIHQATLNPDGSFKLYWKFNDTHIIFEVHGQTTGWIGIGISPSGGMINADIYVGWIKDGNVYITDRHGTDTNAYPPKDAEQNVELLDGSECEGWTMIKFQRQLAACEASSDLVITGDTMRLIYAYGDKDPTGGDLESSDYHGANNRGTKSLYLLTVGNSDNIAFPEGETHHTFDLLNDNFKVPAEDTYYNCRLHKLPEFTEKQHLVKIEPIIQPGHEMNVHHIIAYQCTANLEESENFGTNTKCYASNMPPDFQTCNLVMHAWAIGGGAFYYPKHTGFPLGEVGDPKYVVTETHYDNPLIKSDIVDSSGLRFTYTPQLRTFDSGIIDVGHIVSPFTQIIPPNAESFLDYGDCSEQCLASGMRMKSITEINVFSVELHSHLLGRGLTLKHNRNGTEQPFIAKDGSYDFNYQETRVLSKERVVRTGDSMQMVCDYQSKGERDGITVGGLSTQREMCLAYVFYYPKIPLTFCQSAPEIYTALAYFGIEKFEALGPLSVYEDLSYIMIVEPPELANQTVEDLLNSMDWNKEEVDKFSSEFRDMQRTERCSGPLGFLPDVAHVHDAISIDVPYVEEIQNCTEPSIGETAIRDTTGQCVISETTDVTVIMTTPTPPPNIPITPTENYKHSAVLDNNENVWLYWKFNETYITFELHIQTTGWVGIGISPSGGMINADIYAGWIKNGNAYFTDRHGTETNAYPPKDVEQNVELLDGSECDGWTMIKFQRQLAACEAGTDLAITGDTMRMIYAYGDNDPTGDDLEGSDYHGATNRGSKSLYLLDVVKLDDFEFPEGETYSTFDVANNNFHVPAVDTYYNCRMFKMPELTTKHHLVKVEAIIQPENVRFIHHILLYECSNNLQESEHLSEDHQCYGSNMPEDFQQCILVMQAWAVGGGDFNYPPHAGYPIGDINSPTHLVLEIHYDNPEIKADIVDSSGLRLIYTPQLRQHDSGMLVVGKTVNGYQQVIPPNVDSYYDYGDCPSQCLAAGMADGGVSEMNVFAVMLHSHLAGKQLTLRHIRKGEELSHIARDASYDFNYQEMRLLTEERRVLPKDSLQTLCNYRTVGRTGITMGGFSSREEMCYAFVQYYPRVPISMCTTSPLTENFISYFGIEEYENRGDGTPYGNLEDLWILKPSEIANQTVAQFLNSLEWNKAKADQLSDDIHKMIKGELCLGSNGFATDTNLWVTSPIKIETPYVEEVQNCTESFVGKATSKAVYQCEASTIPTIGDNIDGVTATTGGTSNLSWSLSCQVFTLLLFVLFR